MTKVRTWAGLDVHAAATVACVVDASSGEMSVHRLTGRTSAVSGFRGGLPARPGSAVVAFAQHNTLSRSKQTLARRKSGPAPSHVREHQTTDTLNVIS